jgi:hypothetical protein
MGEARHSFVGSPRTHEQARMEAIEQTMTTPQPHPQEPQCDTGYGGGYSGHHEGGSCYPSHGYPEPSLLARTSASARLSAWWKGSDDSSDGWMTLHMCKQRCKPPSTRTPACCTTSLVTSVLTLMLKSCKHLCLGEVSDAQV